MRLKVKTEEAETYHPVTLSLTFDNQGELDRFYQVFNFTPIYGFIGHLQAATLKKELKDHVKDASTESVRIACSNWEDASTRYYQ